MQPTAVLVVLLAVAVFAAALLAYCLKRMGRDVFISQSYNIFNGRLSKPSRSFRRTAASQGDGTTADDTSDDV